MAGKPFWFWSGDRGLSLMLLFLAAILFFVVPMMELGLVGNLTLAAVFSLILASGVTVVGRRWTVPLAALAFVAIGMRGISLVVESPHITMLDAASSMLACAVLATVVTMQVFREGRINRARIQGAIAVYLLLGLVWASAYELVELARPEAAFASTSGGIEGERFHFIYFSFVVLTTVGFGDITPIDPISRSLVSLEALVGQLYPAILLARLVSMEMLSRD